MMRGDYKKLEPTAKIFVTGSAGFIGYHLVKALLDYGCHVVGIDNMNDYYDVSLKETRLGLLTNHDRFRFFQKDLTDRQALEQIFQDEKPDIVVNLAAQAGVRYSIDFPDTYIQSNIVGFYNVLECCRHYPVRHLVYASSSSVYGSNKKIPFSTDDQTDRPVSLYAATKKSNELMAYCYSKLYGISVTGLRFFTVYGPMGRPDMAYFKFAEKILRGEPIQVYNNGDMKRDFTYVDDIVKGVINILPNVPLEKDGARYKVYNIGNNRPVKLADFIETLEHCLGKTAKKEFLPMQPGDVYQTYADIQDLVDDFEFRPDTPIEEGMRRFTDWFLSYR
ncbi:UDP-N-acetylglucosamine 4-epimerase [Eubacterium plexicaudatum ASF492]|uniref:NAD-dependent epimerase/dehydratase domain-containing protein n=1 Tax=Eubacterium plexicaudatum ASF492 TaxID=1235802 RepID=N2BG11_9FIRM|nr:UDP-N-acetylglucosamine 4-epimerase [Eubacterium plexicaudatum ASF492]